MRTRGAIESVRFLAIESVRFLVIESARFGDRKRAVWRSKTRGLVRLRGFPQYPLAAPPGARALPPPSPPYSFCSLRFAAALLPRLLGTEVPGHTTGAPPVGFEPATDGFRFYATANLDKTSLYKCLRTYTPTHARTCARAHTHTHTHSRCRARAEGHRRCPLPEPNTGLRATADDINDVPLTTLLSAQIAEW